MKYIILAITIFAAIFSYSQNVKIYVLDERKQPLPGATVECIKVKDSSKVYTTTDTKGIALFESLENTLFQIKVSFIGFETLQKSIMVKPTVRTFYFKMKEKSFKLDEVTINAKQPLIRQEEDKMIVDPTNLVSISANTLEVLESTPGLYVDQDNGIYLSSATPAKIYINGREQKLSNQDVTTLLQSLPPGSIKRIEIMRTPSAKYDAASSGGIVNIVLKKGVKIGRFGNINLGADQATFNSQNIGVSINNGGEKSSFYVNANYNHNKKQEDLNTFRYMNSDTLLSQSAITVRNSHHFYTGYGISYDPKEQINLSYDGRINYSLPDADITNNNFTETDDFIRIAENSNEIFKDAYSMNLQQDLAMKYRLDTNGSVVDSRFGFNFYDNKNTEDYTYLFTLPSSFLLAGNGDNHQQRKFAVGQVDLVYKFPLKISFETGLKSSYQHYTSTSNYFVDFSDVIVSDSLRTNSFLYKENISAGYVQITKTFGEDLVLKAGVRAEHTYMDGQQSIPTDTNFLVNRIDFFPYIYLSRDIISLLGIDLRGYLIYRRTINRPGYDMLNPYIDVVDQYLYRTGNPALKPQFTHNYEFNISFNSHPVFAVGQNLTTDIFTEVIYEGKEFENVILQTYDNLGKRKETYFRAMAGIPPGGKYFFVVGSQYNYNEYDGYYQGEPLQYSRGSWRFFTFHVLRVTPNTKLIARGFMMVNGQMGFIEMENFGSIGLGIRQSFMDNRLQVSLNANDILKTMVVDFNIDQNDMLTYGNRYTDSRRFGLKITYKFGIPEKADRGDNPFDFEAME
jgi:iron complex outermembrane recepter protein